MPEPARDRKGFFAEKESTYIFDRFVFAVRTWVEVHKAKALQPFCKFLYEKVKIRPNVLTLFGFIAGVSAPILLIATDRPISASIAIILWFVFDSLDGTMARMYALTSEKTSALDLTADVISSAVILIGISFVSGKLALGLLAAVLFLLQEWLYLVLRTQGKVRTPFHGHLAANISFIFTWHTLGIWLHIVLNIIGTFLAVYFFFFGAGEIDRKGKK